MTKCNSYGTQSLQSFLNNLFLFLMLSDMTEHSIVDLSFRNLLAKTTHTFDKLSYMYPPKYLYPLKCSFAKYSYSFAKNPGK